MKHHWPLILLAVLGAGCSSSHRDSHYYFQRDPVRVAIIPSENATQEPSASVTFNKACEEALRKRGFQVVEADRVVTYAVANGMSIRDLPGLKPSKLGADLKADYVLLSRIDKWENKYQVIQGTSEVGGSSWLYETTTDALLWQSGWHRITDSGNGGGGLAGMLINAALSAAVNSAMDTCSKMGEQAAAETVSLLPQPGFEPAPRNPSPHK